MPPRRVDTEEEVRATVLARDVRENVAAQLHALVIEADQMASGEVVTNRFTRMRIVARDIAEAQGRQVQARVEGLPVAPAARDELEAREALRAAAMSCAVALACWAAAMDYERRKRELSFVNGRRRRLRDEDTI